MQRRLCWRKKSESARLSRCVWVPSMRGREDEVIGFDDYSVIEPIQNPPLDSQLHVVGVSQLGIPKSS
eukprot:COSAG01_NODE_3481_length_6029_cov_3.062785_5_plen_68_part_00